MRAPEDRKGRGSVNVLVESYAKNARTPVAASLAAVLEEPTVLLADGQQDIARFVLAQRFDMGAARKTAGKTAAFIDSVLGAIDVLYTGVVQHITPWTPPAPQVATVPRTDVAPQPTHQQRRGRRPVDDVDGPDTHVGTASRPVCHRLVMVVFAWMCAGAGLQHEVRVAGAGDGTPAPDEGPNPDESPSGGGPPPNPDDAVNCGDFATQAEAQAWHDTYAPYYGDVAGPRRRR